MHFYVLFLFSSKSNIQETRCQKYLLSRLENQLALRTSIVVISMVELSHGFFRWSLYANLGFVYKID